MRFEFLKKGVREFFMKDIHYYFLAFLSLILGVILSVFFKEGHFYTFFSIGLVMIFLKIYNSMSDRKLFYYWRFKHFLLFYSAMLLMSICVDRAGINLGYWIYPSFDKFFDEVLKYLFEWVVALSYIGLVFAIGVLFFIRKGFGKLFSGVLSMLTFVILIGVITEIVNVYSFSWKVLAMPFSNLKIGSYFFVFQTLGYWLMALVPVIAYKIAEAFKSENSNIR